MFNTVEPKFNTNGLITAIFSDGVDSIVKTYTDLESFIADSKTWIKKGMK